MPVTILQYDVSKGLTSKHASRVFKKIDGCTVKLQINDKVADALEKSKDSDLVTTKIAQSGLKLCEAISAELASSMAKLEKDIEGKDKDQTHKLVVAYRTDVKNKLKGLEGKLKVLPEEKWKKFLAKYAAAKKEYRSYKIDCTVDIAIGSLGVVASAAAIGGAAHTGGASLVLGIIGMARSVAKVANTVYIICVDVEKYGNDLRGEILKMVDEFKKSKGKATAKDLGKSAINTIVGVGFFTTVSTAGKKNEAFGGKVAGAVVGGVKLSQEVTKSLKEADALEKKMSSLQGKDLKKAQDKLKKLQENFGKLFDFAADLNAKAKRCEQSCKQIKAALVVLKSKTELLEKVEKAIDILANLALAGASAGTDFASASQSALEIAKTSVSLAADLGVTAKDAL